MTEFWERHASGERGPRITLRNQPCGIYGCGNPAEEGGHVWLRCVGARNELCEFCFIMPICGSCNTIRKDKNEDNFFWRIKKKTFGSWHVEYEAVWSEMTK